MHHLGVCLVEKGSSFTVCVQILLVTETSLCTTLSQATPMIGSMVTIKHGPKQTAKKKSSVISHKQYISNELKIILVFM